MLPDFIPPMLAKLGEPFDSDEHVFEIKWDGTRALSFIDGGYRLLNRRKYSMIDRYPELAFLGSLDRGTVIDGEVVVFVDGKPSFRATMQRDHVRDPKRSLTMSREMPASYIVFDLLYHHGEDLTTHPLSERRERLRELVEGCDDGHLVFSEGIVGNGREYYAQAVERELEGVVAKRLSSKYESGIRSGAWTKIKRKQELHCVVIGFLAEAGDDLRSLIIAAESDGELRCVGRVGSGLRGNVRAELIGWLRAHPRDEPLVPCPYDGEWVEPGLFCTVTFLEHTADGNLRAPVFERHFYQ